MGVDPGALPHELVRACDHQAPVVAAGPEAGQRVREDREAGRRGERRERLGERRIVVRTRDDEPAAPRRRGDPRVDRVAASSRRAPAVDPGRERSLDPLAADSGPSGQQRLAERHVEMHGTRGSGERRRDRATRQRPHVRRGRRIAVEQRQLREPLRLPPVEVVLVDRLRRSPVAQLGAAGRR